jgi:hypothetical protein
MKHFDCPSADARQDDKPGNQLIVLHLARGHKRRNQSVLSAFCNALDGGDLSDGETTTAQIFSFRSQYFIREWKGRCRIIARIQSQKSGDDSVSGACVKLLVSNSTD